MEPYLDKREWSGVAHSFIDEKVSVRVKYPELKPIFKPIDNVDEESIYRYIIAYYNPKSPVRYEPDLIARKRAALQVAGVRPTRFGKYGKEVEAIIKGGHAEVNKMIIDYCYLVAGVDFTILAVYEQGLYNELTALMGRAFTKDTVKKIKEITDEIDEMKNRLIAQDTFSRELSQALYDKTESIRLELRPEDIAEKLEKGIKPVDIDPYGPDYNFELSTDLSKLRKV